VIREVLVGLDASARAPKVLEAAVALARPLGARLHLLRALELPPDIPASAATSGDPLPAYAMQKALEELGALAAGYADVAFGASLVRVGRAWREVIAAARALDVDLIVVGSHGFFGWDRVLGTNAARIANLADRDVLVVHPR